MILRLPIANGLPFSTCRATGFTASRQIDPVGGPLRAGGALPFRRDRKGSRLQSSDAGPQPCEAGRHIHPGRGLEDRRP